MFLFEAGDGRLMEPLKSKFREYIQNITLDYSIKHIFTKSKYQQEYLLNLRAFNYMLARIYKTEISGLHGDLVCARPTPWLIAVLEYENLNQWVYILIN